jgi:GT2 family glycosyltransferase
MLMLGDVGASSVTHLRHGLLDAAPEVSVVIATYLRPALLARCLARVLAQDLAPRCYEIVVCDDGCDPDTYEVVHTFAVLGAARGLQVRYVPVDDTQGPAGARNRGWRAARAPLIAFTDDDTLPEPDWLRAGLRTMASGAAAAAGRVRVPLPDHPTDYEHDAAGLERAEFATANCFVRRGVLAEVGGFEQRYTSAWREDSDLQFSILEAGGAIVQAPEAMVVHPVRPARWGTSIAQQRKSQFDALLRKRHPKLYAQRIAAHPPWFYYGVLASLLLAALGVLMESAAAATVGLGVWAVLTGVFALQRLRGTSHAASHLAEMIVTSLAIPPLSIFWRLYGAVKFRTRFL